MSNLSESAVSDAKEDLKNEESNNNDIPEVKDQCDNQCQSEIDDGDPIPSGTGSVSKDCSASELLGWSEILPKWHNKLDQRPKGLNNLVRNGIPEPLRAEVWQLLSGAHHSSYLMEKYRVFLTRQAPSEQIIMRDIHRTYPAHENFRSDNNGSSSLLDSLYKVCKAYAVYDEEVGYCQGLSFLVAALLLHMPEEQAFCVFVRIMQHYGLRNLFRNNFDELYLKFYQLEHLLEDQIPDLHRHFSYIGIEPFTYASQWFLTVFTAKFPLNAVYYILDIFLLDGMDTIFQIALALLSLSKNELLALDFEGVLKFFRVHMPKIYRDQENVQQLIHSSLDISLKKLSKHAKNYNIAKQKEKLLEDPLRRAQKENSKLTENNLRLEQENDDLARELVASKIHLRSQMDKLEDRVETLRRALAESQMECKNHLATMSDIEDEKVRLEVEVSQLKEVCRRELNRAETELSRDSNIISDYKKICSQLSRRVDKQVEGISTFIKTLENSMDGDDMLNKSSFSQIFKSESEKVIRLLESADENEIESNKSKKSNSIQETDNEGSPQKVSLGKQQRPLGAYIKSPEFQSLKSTSKIDQLMQHVDDLEVELAKTKLALVEAECKCQQLTHDINAGLAVKTTNSSLTKKLQASLSSRKSPKASRNAFSLINNLITERISMYGAPVSTDSNDSKLDTSEEPPSPTHLAKSLQASENDKTKTDLTTKPTKIDNKITPVIDQSNLG